MRQINWRLLSSVAIGASIIFLSLIAYTPYSFVYLPLVTLVIGLVLVVLLVTASVRRRRHECLSLSLTLLALIGVTGGFFLNRAGLRPHLRWLLWSRGFKAEVLAQPAPANGDLRHIEWEATGFAGVANNTVYLVFDSTNALSKHSSGNFDGIPCKVPRVRRLESQWYAVYLYTDEVWGQCTPRDAVGR